MKATGIVRRLDDLGRIVIPKEIRRTLKLREGDPMELFIEKDYVCYRKYNPLSVDIDTFKNVFQAALKSSDTLPAALLVSSCDILTSTHGHRSTSLRDDVRNIGICERYAQPTIQKVDETVVFADTMENFEVGYIRHIFDRYHEYVASVLIAPGTLSAVDTGIIQTLVSVIAAICE